MQVEGAQFRGKLLQFGSVCAAAIQPGRRKSAPVRPPAPKRATPFSASEDKGKRARQVAAVLAARGALGGAIVCAFLIYVAGSAYVASLIITLILGCLAGWLARGCL